VIIKLRAGQTITPRRIINPAMAGHWKYAQENASIGGGLMPGARLVIKAVSIVPGNMWVEVELPGRSPVATIKIAGEEYANNFESVA